MHLHTLPTTAPDKLDKEKIIKQTLAMIDEIHEFQYKLFAEGDRSVLVILQGLDASGKDGVVRHIFGGMNPLSVNAVSFRAPSKEELAHDFLRRVHGKVPAKGCLTIFNRSHYEDILVPTVEGYIDKETIKKRYDQINAFENLLQENGTTIVKLYLNVSKKAQKERLQERLTDPQKYWKHNVGDWATRQSFSEYQAVYEKIFATCDKPERHIIAADQNWYKLYQIATILLDTYKSMDLKRPPLPADHETRLLEAQAEIDEIKEEVQEKEEKNEKSKKIVKNKKK